MTAFTSRTLARHASLLDLAAIWVTLTATFAYLEVPLVNAPLFATALVLQAALGTVVITRLLKGAQPSLLMLLGPGLILGGALSFAIFQVVGRGIVGVVASTLAGLASMTMVGRPLLPELQLIPRWWMLGQLVGVGMLAIASEFAELLPIAVFFFLIGFLGRSKKCSSHWLTLAACIAGAVVIVTTYLLRQNYWWLVTDDYQLLEVIMRHLTAESPFAPWGVTSFASYHWLSYGWAGFLDLAAGSPPSLVTLTRVMPIAYSISMAASLTLVQKLWRTRSSDFTPVIAVWVVVGVTRIDWSGTSTGGVYASVAALVPVLIIAHKSGLSARGVVTSSLALAVVALTKLPAIFAATLLSFHFLIAAAQKRIRQRVSWGYGAFLLVPTLPLVISAIWLLTFLVPGRYKFVSVNPQLGQISLFGRDFAAIALMLSQPWTWFAVLILLAVVPDRKVTRTPITSQPDLVFLLAAIGGVTLDVAITSNADNHKYFSGPMYFVSALAILRLASVLDDSLNGVKQTKSRWLFGLIPFLAGVVWFNLEGVQGFWNLLGQLTGARARLELELLKFATNDSRFAAISVTTGMLLAISYFTGLTPTIRKALSPVMIALVLLTFVQLVDGSISSFRDATPASEIVDSIGSYEEVEAGRWLRSNVADNDLIGTNHLFGDEGGGVDNMALAVWSQREFFVLGPSLGSKIEQHRIAAMSVSRSFADDPSAATCRRISQAGVKWFVVDKRLTETRDWSVCAKPNYSNSHFTILKVTSVGSKD